MKKLSFVKKKLKQYGRNYILSCLFLMSFVGLKAQFVSNYSFSQSSGTYTPIAGGTNMVLLSTATGAWDSQFFHNGTGGINGTTTSGTYAAFPIGFNFTYNGTAYDGFYMSTDGALRLATTTASSIGSLGGSTPISTTTSTAINLISAFGADLIGGIRAGSLTRTSGSAVLNLTGTSTAVASMLTPGMRVLGTGIPAGATVVSVSGSDVTISSNATASSTTGSATFVDVDNISYVTTGSPGSQVLTVQWKNVSRFSGSGDRLNFQVKLYEGTNVIQVIYNTTASTQVTTGSTVQVGLKGTSNADFNNRSGSGTSAWSTSALGTVNTSTIAFQGAAATGGEIIPANGLIFTWTPPVVCTGTPAAGTVSPTMQTLVPGQSPANLVVSGFSSGVSGLTFQWEQSADNATWTNAVGGSGATTTTYTPPTYAGTAIYYRCKVTCTNSATNAFTSSVVLDSCPAATSYSDDFEATTGSAFSQCWAKFGTGSAYPQASTAISGARNLYMYSTSASAVAYVMMPTVSNLQAGTHRLRFKARSNVTIGGKIDVGYFATPGDAATFTQVGSSYTTTSLTAIDVFDTGALTLPAGITNLVFRHNPSPANSVLIDDVVYEQVPSCIEPTAVTVSSITSSGATISWTAPATAPANGYEYYYSTTNTAPTASTTASGTSTSTTASLSGLAPSTTYYVWVRSVCSASDKSVWSVLKTFTTACVAVAAPFTENFNTAAISNCWSTYSTNNTGYALWQFGNTAQDYGTTYSASGQNNTAGQFAYVDASSPYTGIHDVTLLSPQVNLSGLTTPVLEFRWFKNHGTAVNPTSQPAYDNNKLTVDVRDVATSTWETVFMSTSNAATWRTESITLPSAYVGKTIQVRFVVDKDVAGNGYFYDNLLLDDVSLKELSGLATSEVHSENNIKMYPNPFSDVLNISDIKNVKSIAVIDVTGRLVKTIDIPSLALHLGELKSGLYVVVLTMKDGSKQTIKAIKK